MAISTGSRVGPYEVTAQLGQGGMGVVFRGRDSRLQRDVALKARLEPPVDLAVPAAPDRRCDRERPPHRARNEARRIGDRGVRGDDAFQNAQRTEAFLDP